MSSTLEGLKARFNAQFKPSGAFRPGTPSSEMRELQRIFEEKKAQSDPVDYREAPIDFSLRGFKKAEPTKSLSELRKSFQNRFLDNKSKEL